ncbi:MAG TPA: YIP1 family protein, partial [Roseiflexaceae bacterium]|nr:YIP1 family protein [Roseiflexaceae bacterium]
LGFFGKVWLGALVRPSVRRYAALGQQPRVSAWKAYLWVFAAGMIGGAINALSPFITQPADLRYVDLLLLALIPVSALLAAGALAAFAGCAQVIARLLKGTGTQRELAYVFAAFSAPLLIVASIVDLIPPARVLLIILYLYWMVLYVMAVRAVNGISRLKAAMAVLAALLILGLAWLGLAFIAGSWGVLLP